MKPTLLVLQVISAVLLSLVILIQARGSGLGAAFGGSGEFYVTKRGAEKVLSIATVIIAVVFILLSVTATLIN
mgnify:CR=1 FL=1|jgi:protein translocase SecG subunit